MGYYSLIAKKENGHEITENDKRDFVADVISIRLSESVRPDDPITARIVAEIGSRWDDLPMPVAAIDLPDLVENYFLKFS
ncbi:MAG: hypothetical protein QXU18_00310 [Thermoplasmatales archaeon]